MKILKRSSINITIDVDYYDHNAVDLTPIIEEATQ